MQVTVAVGSSAVQQYGFPAFFGQLRADRCMIERQVHSITRLGMRCLKIELRAGWQACAGAPQRDAGGRQAAQFQPRIGGRGVVLYFVHRLITHARCASA
ncbi:hypothetical protein ALP29_200050 [Pseudomonas syringae pv. avii]|uniref:Uncharacterized protein n=1 Tax=Pseudomonas syringae pv. avii TaxID=663959 RepID=A0A3M5V7D2_PSESX|nr:hypothetical protein ALP29_200050 [Pseudomonas syringae pv. avii]